MTTTIAETFIGIDFGLRNMGIAVGNTLSKTAQPLTVIRARDGVPDWDQLLKIAADWKPDKIIVGLPLNMDGSKSKISEIVERFARHLEGQLGLTVILVDERLSSREAKQTAVSAGHNGDFSARPIDDLAATIILSTFLNSL